MIYQLADYIREKIPFPDSASGDPFDPQVQFFVGGDIPDDPVDMVLLKENQGVSTGFPQNRQDVPVQFLARGETAGRARDLAFAIYTADALSSVDGSGRRFRERHGFYLKQGGIRVARFSFIQPPYELPADVTGYFYSFNAMVVFGDE